MKIYRYIPFALLAGLFASCSETVQVSQTLDEQPEIFPDYIGVTIPSNIAPLNFSLKTEEKIEAANALFTAGQTRFELSADEGSFTIPPSKWREMLADSTGDSLQITVRIRKEGSWIAYSPFTLYISKDQIDSYLAYRLIEPGYELWNRMGIYQRCLEDYEETPILENQMTGFNCMNCHSFCMQNPDKMLFHLRETHAGTLLVQEGRIEKLETKTDSTLSSLVYPSWHPSGKYVAFSTNKTNQFFHLNDPNRIEVYDQASDVVVYDVEKHEIVTAERLSSPTAFETFPTFSPDGQALYFCTADARKMPMEYKEVKYNLCAIPFDPASRTFGPAVDTLYQAGLESKSASFPRISPDGRFLLYTLSGYGNFSIWHKDADLAMIDLQKKKNSRMLDAVNSPDVESYHSWSSNSRWFVFSSRRLDGLYTRPFIAHVSENGMVGKPFLLPQRSTDHYQTSMKSFNIPEFITAPVRTTGAALAEKAKGTDVEKVRFAGSSH